MLRRAAAASGLLACLRFDFTAVIMAAMSAHMMRALQLAAIAALDIRGSRKRVMRTAHVALGGRGLSFGDSHVTRNSGCRFASSPIADKHGTGKPSKREGVVKSGADMIRIAPSMQALG